MKSKILKKNNSRRTNRICRKWYNYYILLQTEDEIETEPDILQELEKEKDDYTNELYEVIKHFENIKFTNKITNLTTRRKTPRELHDNEFNEEEQYDFDRPEFNDFLNKNNERSGLAFSEKRSIYSIKTLSIQNLSIELGTDVFPRFSCACHKNNIAVRWAISKDENLSKALTLLSSLRLNTKISLAALKERQD